MSSFHNFTAPQTTAGVASTSFVSQRSNSYTLSQELADTITSMSFPIAQKSRKELI